MKLIRGKDPNSEYLDQSLTYLVSSLNFTIFSYRSTSNVPLFFVINYFPKFTLLSVILGDRND
jgi:hypothetical protein